MDKWLPNAVNYTEIFFICTYSAVGMIMFTDGFFSWYLSCVVIVQSDCCWDEAPTPCPTLWLQQSTPECLLTSG